MALEDFLRKTQAEVREEVNEGSTPYPELAFCEIVMQHMSDAGMTCAEPSIRPFKGKVGSANLRLSGYAMSDDVGRLDLFVSLYEGVDEIAQIKDSELSTAAEQCLRFLRACAEGKLAAKLDPSDDVRSLAELIHGAYNELEQIHIYVLTDKVSKAKRFKTQEIGGKAVRLEVMDIERLFRRTSEGKGRDEIVVDFTEVSGAPIPCVFVPGVEGDYDYALAAIPGSALRALYDRFHSQLLEANVRSFLSIKSKGVNAGIQTTLRSAPARFMAYNNGIVVIADEMRVAKLPDGSLGIAWLKGLQIVNGGQTTAAIYFAKRKHPDIDLAKVRVPAKIIVMRQHDPAAEEVLISDISRFANTQNAVSQSDLSANKPFHVELEKLSNEIYCPDGIGRWFYERAAGSYATMLAREGTSTKLVKAIKEHRGPSRRITKTDLAKYLSAWDMKPDYVSQGSQKNFVHFMGALTTTDNTEKPLPTVAEYKRMIAKTLLYREITKMFRKAFPAFQGNITAYTVSLMSKLLGDKLNFDRIWTTQSLSEQLLAQTLTWGKEVDDALKRTANGKMISEWAKKPECKQLILDATYSKPAKGIPELSASA